MHEENLLNTLALPSSEDSENHTDEACILIYSNLKLRQEESQMNSNLYILLPFLNLGKTESSGVISEIRLSLKIVVFRSFMYKNII